MSPTLCQTCLKHEFAVRKCPACGGQFCCMCRDIHDCYAPDDRDEPDPPYRCTECDQPCDEPVAGICRHCISDRAKESENIMNRIGSVTGEHPLPPTTI